MKRITLLLVLAVASPAPAFAQAKPQAAEVDEARERFQRGVELYKEGSFDAALAEFNRAYSLAPNYRVLFNIAQVQTERHDYAGALNDFEKYLQQGGAEISAERREQVNKEIDALKARVARVTVSSDVDGAELLVDGVSAGTLPLSDPVVVSAGVRQFQVRKAGYETAAKTETIAGGETPRLEFHLQAIAGAAAPAIATTPPVFAGAKDDEAAPADHGPNVPFWITLGTTAALAGGAVTFGVLTHSADQRLDSQLNTFPPNKGGIDDARTVLKRDALITDILTGAAVVSGGLCAYFAIAGAHHKSKEAAAPRTLSIGAAGTGIRVRGTF